jgi:hypothetical protein
MLIKDLRNLVTFQGDNSDERCRQEPAPRQCVQAFTERAGLPSVQDHAALETPVFPSTSSSQCCQIPLQD